MFLADSLRVIVDGLPADNALLESKNIVYMRDRAADVLSNYDLVSFSRSALSMASDLRIDTPERLESIARAVFYKKRRVFLEANYDEREKAFSNMEGFPETPLPDGRYTPKRVGLSVDCDGDGRARIGVLWNFSRSQARGSLGPLRQSGRTKLEREAEQEMGRLGVGFCYIDVDLNRDQGMEAAEFQNKYIEGHPDVAQMKGDLEGMDLSYLKSGTARQRAREAWRLYRLNQISSASLDPGCEDAARELLSISGKGPKEIIRDAERDLDGEIIYALALLAALEVEGDSLRREVREARPARRERKVSAKDVTQDRLSVLSLNISDEALLRRISEGSVRRGAGEGTSGSRVRHPVRGHLFRARNGKIVYRRPHWRGGEIKKAITQVR